MKQKPTDTSYRERGTPHQKGKLPGEKRHSRWLWFADAWCGVVLGSVVSMLLTLLQ